MDKIQIGQIFYMEDDNGDLDIVRVHSKKNGLIISRGVSKKRVDDNFLDDYTALIPDGRLFLNVLNMGPSKDHGQDVTAILIRESDIDEGITEPYAVCRQNIHDEYSNPFVGEDGVEILGMSMNRDNVPRNSNFSDMLISHSVEYNEIIYVYRNDTLDIILSMIENVSKYNNVLNEIYKVLSNATVKYTGLSRSISALLKSTDFMYDFNEAFDITMYDGIIKVDENGSLDNRTRFDLEYIFKVEMFQTYVVPYNLEIDLSNIKRDYELVKDKNGKLFIVGFDKGAYVNTYIDKDTTILDTMTRMRTSI